MDALFNVYKPKGLTSHDVVVRLRRASGVRRIGHAGTLDPLAEGVLVVAAGQATRVIEYLAGLDKAYRAEVTFGVETETYDAEGKIIAERPAAHLTRDDLEAVLARFRGPITQRPPAYSAVSVGGQRLYDLARRGQVVVAPARDVEITRLDLARWQPPVATVLVECSKGTYIRSLAHDLGAALETGAHLSALVRLRVGPFGADQAVPLADLEEQFRSRTWQAAAIALDKALASMPVVQLSADAAGRLANGLPFDAGPAGNAVESVALLRAYDAAGNFIAIARQEQRGGRVVLRPDKVFVRSTPAPLSSSSSKGEGE